MSRTRLTRRRLNTPERGQTLVLFVFALAALMGLTALTIDVGLVYIARGDMQGAADAGALAGAQELPKSSSAAVAAALKWAENNGFANGVDGTTVSVTTPYQGDSNAIRVEIAREMPALLAGAVGVPDFEVRAAAVARRDASAGYAVFGAEDSRHSRSVEFTGGSFTVYGNVHSNSRLKMTGGRVFVDGTASYVSSAHIRGFSKVFTGGLAQVDGPVDWPLYFEYSDFGTCTFESSRNMDINARTRQYWVNDDPRTRTLKPGLYCAGGNIHLSGASFSGEVTFIAHGHIRFSSGRLDFTPWVNNVVAFSDHGGSNAIRVSAGWLTWKGIFMATHGDIDMRVWTARSESGGIYGNRVDLSGGSYHIVGDGGTSPGPIHLVE